MGLTLKPGSWSDAEALVGTVIARQSGADAVNPAMVRHFREALEWPVVLSGGTSEVPLSMVITFAMPAYWEPGSPPISGNMVPPLAFGSVPAPGDSLMATSTEFDFHARLQMGDQISTIWTLAGLTRKETRVGDGAFMYFEIEYFNQSDEHLATERTSVFRYTSRENQ